MAARCTSDRDRGGRRVAARLYQAGEPVIGRSVCRGFGEEAVSNELAIAVDGIEVDMQSGICGELLELLSDADEGFLTTQLLGEELIECGQE